MVQSDINSDIALSSIVAMIYICILSAFTLVFGKAGFYFIGILTALSAVILAAIGVYAYLGLRKIVNEGGKTET